MEQNLLTILTFAAGLLAIVISTYGAIITAKVNAWSKAKLAEHGLKEAAKWQADLKAGLLTGAKAALLEGKSIPDAIKAAINHTLASNKDAASGLKPSSDVLERLAKAAVSDAVSQATAATSQAVKDRLAEALKDAGLPAVKPGSTGHFFGDRPETISSGGTPNTPGIKQL